MPHNPTKLRSCGNPFVIMNTHKFLLIAVVGALCLSGCSLNANKAFSWLNPNKPKAPEAASPDLVAAGDRVNKEAAIPVTLASASRKASSIQRELGAFQSFPFQLDLSDVSGRPIRLQDHLGKVVIVDLWGTWCGPCRKVIPHLVKLQNKHPQQLQVIGLCNERTPDTGAATESLTAAMNEFRINYPCALIDDKTVSKVPTFSGYPTMLFIDRTGKVRMVTVGVKAEAYWDSLVEELLAS